jgi:hypothetical protein
MTDREQKQWLYLSNPKSWQNIAKEKAYRQRQKHITLFQRFAKFDTGQELKQLFTITWESLFTGYLEAESCTPFHQLNQESEANQNVTISLLECTVKRLPDSVSKTGSIDTTFCITPNTNINSAKTAHNTVLPTRYCSTCGKDISQQRKNSRFCSAGYIGERAARICRNKDSNQRRHFKTVINKAMQQNNFIAVTFTDSSGTTNKQTLHPSELPTLSRQWFDSVKAISILPIRRDELPVNLEGEQAKCYLQSLTNNQNLYLNL